MATPRGDGLISDPACRVGSRGWSAWEGVRVNGRGGQGLQGTEHTGSELSWPRPVRRCYGAHVRIRKWAAPCPPRSAVFFRVPRMHSVLPVKGEHERLSIFGWWLERRKRRAATSEGRSAGQS